MAAPTDDTAPFPRSAPPNRLRRRPMRRQPMGRARGVDGLGLRPGFWASWWGLAATVFVLGVIVALLVGWVLLWVEREGGTSVALLTIGSVGFAAVLVVLIGLLFGVRRRARLHAAEAAFLAAVSHALRTPVAGIRAASQALSHPELPEARATKLRDAILRETARLSRLIDNVLETGRVEVGTKAYAGERVDLRQLTMQLVAERAPSVVDGQLRGEAPDGADALTVIGDTSSLRLTLDNLVDNALRYHDGEADVTLRVAPIGRWALVQIVDRGRGFTADEARGFFRAFRRGDLGPGGSGLGLALARSVARMHGGELRLSSDGPGRGATAELWIPRVDDADEGVPDEALGLGPASAAPAPRVIASAPPPETASMAERSP